MYATVKSPVPKYNDIFSEVFAKKTHQAYQRRERADLRAQFIGNKFSDIWATGDKELDKKIAEEAERRTVEKAVFQD